MYHTSDSNKMKYGQVAGNCSINALIYRCFEYICEDDERKFVRKFHEQPHASDQIMHTFRELVLGAYLSSCGLKVRYDFAIDSETPDWCILDDRSAVIGIVELTNFHIDKATDNEIEKQLWAKRSAVYWRDGNKNNVNRLHDCLRKKADKYKPLIEKLGVPYVIAIFPEFRVAVDFEEELGPCLVDENAGLFRRSELSGVLYFEEGGGKYSFRYAINSNAIRPLAIRNGSFSLEAI